MSSSAEGVLYDPAISTDAKCVEALAVADIDDDGNPEVVADFPPDSILVIEYVAESGNPVSCEWSRVLSSARSAPILQDLDDLDEDPDSLEIVISGDDWWIYVWTFDGQTFRKPADSSGQFMVSSDSVEYCYRSLSVGDIYPDSAGVEIVQALENGKLAAYPTTQYWGAGGTPTIWTYNPPGSQPLTRPLIGDVDDDMSLEVVTLRQKVEHTGLPASAEERGGVWIVTAASGALEDSITAGGYGFRFVGDPAAPAALADLDGDDGLEIVAGGGQWSKLAWNPIQGHPPWSSTLRAHLVFDGASGLDTVTVDDATLIPGRKWAATATSGQPVVGDLDDDGNLEVLIPTNAGYLACVEWDASGDSARAERGWPQLFADAPMTPIVADVNPSTDNLEMVVVDRSGFVHVLQLPGDADGAALPWPEYGHDPRNTFNATTARDLGDSQARRGPGPGLVSSRPHLRIGPNPPRPVACSSFALQTQSKVTLKIYDLQGRCVRTLVNEVLPAGEYRIPWDGHTDAGTPVAGGGVLRPFGGSAGD